MKEKSQTIDAAMLDRIAASLIWSFLWLVLSAFLAAAIFLLTGDGQFHKTVQLCVTQCAEDSAQKHIASPEADSKLNSPCPLDLVLVELSYSQSIADWFSGRPGKDELEDIRAIGEICKISSVSTTDSIRSDESSNLIESSFLLLFAVCLSLVAVLATVSRKTMIRNRIDLRFVIGALVIGLLAGLSSGWVAVDAEEKKLVELASKDLSLIHILFAYIIVLPLCEELLFRYLVLEEWRRRNLGRFGLLVSSFWFAGAHVAVTNLSGGWIALSFIFILGLLAGVAYLRIGLLAAISVHMVYNAALFVVQAALFA